ncbi:hypothetical protein CU098_001226 [Rhizopus stolonifer]|uniref:Nitrogen regulatory protein areA GATA-like domain-containing protein n=1 Tax=Rhizopus stolonifer TaxID=4846 RepID=A0A367KTP5_RHIST|nr:hypothetical protein CU098_001226 [Rhizopus stolonifer]
MVYLMWHARRPSVIALHDISKVISNQQTSDCQLDYSKETAAIANRTSSAFKKFCKQVLTATQLSESVILLGLKYIAMLLQSNPSIQGAAGSEYRLFTVALMLGNKFLDDNTFTNKTWSKVTGMKVKDLNMMELEFLNVLGFQLFVQKEEFGRYKRALLLFRHQLLNADGHLLKEAFKSATNSQQTRHQMMSTSKAQLPQFSTQPFDKPLSQTPLHTPQSNVIPTPTYRYTTINKCKNYIENGQRLEYMSWRLWQYKTLHKTSAPASSAGVAHDAFCHEVSQHGGPKKDDQVKERRVIIRSLLSDLLQREPPSLSDSTSSSNLSFESTCKHSHYHLISKEEPLYW